MRGNTWPLSRRINKETHKRMRIQMQFFMKVTAATEDVVYDHNHLDIHQGATELQNTLESASIKQQINGWRASRSIIRDILSDFMIVRRRPQWTMLVRYASTQKSRELRYGKYIRICSLKLPKRREQDLDVYLEAYGQNVYIVLEG